MGGIFTGKESASRFSLQLYLKLIFFTGIEIFLNSLSLNVDVYFL